MGFSDAPDWLEPDETFANDIKTIQSHPTQHMIDEATAFSLDAVVHEPDMRPVRMVVYGPIGIGKSTLASRFPRAIGAFTEDGVRNIRVARFPKIITTYSELMSAMSALLSSVHQYQTFFLDTVDWLEPLVWAEACRRNHISSIEEPGYGKGYLMADDVWAELLQGFDALRDAGMHIVLLGHSEVTSFSPPESDKYDRYDLALHKRARAMIHEWADVVGFAYEKNLTKTIERGTGKSKTTTTKGGSSVGRFLALQRRSTHEAKNGYGLPDEIPLDAQTADTLLGLIAESFATAV